VACLGNHEHEYMWYSPWFPVKAKYNVDDWRHWYESIGAHLLVNEAQPLTRGSARLWMVGVDDATPIARTSRRRWRRPSPVSSAWS